MQSLRGGAGEHRLIVVTRGGIEKPPPHSSHSLTVIQPINYGRDGDAALEHLLLRAHQHRRNVTAVAPAPDAHSGHIQVI